MAEARATSQQLHREAAAEEAHHDSEQKLTHHVNHQLPRRHAATTDQGQGNSRQHHRHRVVEARFNLDQIQQRLGQAIAEWSQQGKHRGGVGAPHHRPDKQRFRKARRP